MAALFFEDTNGEMHEIKLQAIKKQSLKKGDVLVVNYEVGDAPSDQANDALRQLREIFRRVIPEGVEIVIIATRNGEEDISLKIMKDKTQE